MELTELKKRPFSVVVLYPTERPMPTELHDELYKDVLYEKLIYDWTPKFVSNFVQLLYYLKRVTKEFGTGPLKVLFLKYRTEKYLRAQKVKIRRFYKTGHNSNHSCDTHEEAKLVMGILNPNTIDYLRRAPTLHIPHPNFNRLLVMLLKFCKKNRIDTDTICITGDAVLSVYSIRDCAHMSLFAEDAAAFAGSVFTVYSCKADPLQYFYYMNIKFSTLELVCPDAVIPEVVGDTYPFKYDVNLFEAVTLV